MGEAKRGPPPRYFCKNVIPGEFKSFKFVRVDPKGVTVTFFVRVRSKGLERNWSLVTGDRWRVSRQGRDA